MTQYIRVAIVMSVLVMLLMIAGCAFNTAPKFNIDPVTQKPIMVKRYPKYPAWQELFFWKTKEYRKNDGEITWLLSDEQKKIIEQYGQPEYIRRVFFSNRGDRIHEWLFWEKQRVVQFVDGAVVYEGQLSDLEKVLLLYGRPKGYVFNTTEELNNVKIWITYKRWMGSRIREFYFINDRMYMGKELI